MPGWGTLELLLSSKLGWQETEQTPQPGMTGTLLVSPLKGTEKG